jgi:hypothetical protein
MDLLSLRVMEGIAFNIGKASLKKKMVSYKLLTANGQTPDGEKKKVRFRFLLKREIDS